MESFVKFKIETNNIFSREITFIPIEYGSFSWRDLIVSLYNGERIFFQYSVYYYSANDLDRDRPPRFVAFECSTLKIHAERLRANPQFRWDDKLPPVFSPKELDCKSISESST